MSIWPDYWPDQYSFFERTHAFPGITSLFATVRQNIGGHLTKLTPRGQDFPINYLSTIIKNTPVKIFETVNDTPTIKPGIENRELSSNLE